LHKKLLTVKNHDLWYVIYNPAFQIMLVKEGPMSKVLKRISAFLAIIITVQFYYPISDKVFAENSGSEQQTVLQSKLEIEFQALPAQGIKAVVKGKLAFVTAGINGLLVVDIQDPAKLCQLAYVEFPEIVSFIGICGNYIYLPAQNNLYIVDITDPLSPVCILETPMYSNEPLVSIAMDSNRMYLANEKNIDVFLLEEPLKPLFLTSFCINDLDEAFTISDIAVHDGSVYAARGQKGIGIYDFSDINNIVCIDVYNSLNGYCNEVDFYGNCAFLSIPDKKGIEILYISNTKKLEYIGFVENIRSIICIEENTAYVANVLGCLSIMDLSQYLLPVAVRDLNNAKTKDENQKIAYITIDDGPSRSITPINLDTLKKYGVKATFFVLSRTGMNDIYKRIIDEGHIIGNHSFSHDYDYLYSSTENFKKDVLKARDLIYKKIKYTSTVFRFPGGTMGLSQNTLKQRSDILAELGYKYFDWDVTTADTDPNLKKYGDEAYIVNLLANNVIKEAKGRKKLIILMHDSSGKIYSAKALPKIIEGLTKQGYVFDVLTNY